MEPYLLALAWLGTCLGLGFMAWGFLESWVEVRPGTSLKHRTMIYLIHLVKRLEPVGAMLQDHQGRWYIQVGRAGLTEFERRSHEDHRAEGQ